MIASFRTLLLLLLTAGPAAALAPEAEWLRDGQKAFDRLVSRQAEDYREMDRAFIEAQARAPDDAALAVAHCNLFWWVWDIEGLDWPNEAQSRHADCLASLAARLPDAPEVQVLLAEQDHGEDRAQAALDAWEHSADWPPALRARLAKVLAESDQIGDRSGDFAIEAVRLGDSSTLPDAIRRLAAVEGADAAARFAARAPLAGTRWQLDAQLQALAALKHPTAARDHLARHNADVTASLPVAVDILTEAGDFVALETLLQEREEAGDDTRAARLALAVARDDAGAALEHYELDFDEFAGSARDYFRILGLNPVLALAPGLLPFTLVLAFIGLAVLLAPLLVLVPVHYRGLARRIAGRAPAPVLPGLGLRHAWYGLGVCLLLVPMFLMSLVIPEEMGKLLAGDDAAAATLTVTLWSTLGALVALLPTLYWLRRPQWTVPVSDSLGMLGRVLLAYLIGFGVGIVCVLVQGWTAASGMSVETSTFHTSMFDEGVARYGIFVTVLVIGVLVPIVEEWVFRGLLLGGLSKHIHFGWANLLQASLFMVIHDDLMRFPFYLAIGLLAGWLVKRYRSLLPAVLLHVLNNCIAALLMAA